MWGSILKAAGTALLGRAVKKGVKGAGKAVVKGTKSAGKAIVKGGKSAQAVAGGVKEATKVLPHALFFGATMAPVYGVSGAANQLKTIVGGAYIAGKGAVKQKQGAKILQKLLKSKELKNIRNTNQLSDGLMKFYNANRARQPAVAEMAKYTWRGLKKMIKGAPTTAKKAVVAGATGVKEAGKTGMSDYLVGRAVQIGGATLAGVATTGATVAVVDEIKGKK
jgi:hypothetical protein